MTVTDINTILDNNWDTNIIAKPTFIKKYSDNYRFYQSVVASEKIDIDDEVVGIGQNRLYYSEESGDIFICHVINTSQANVELMFDAIKKVCSTYSPTSNDNILQWIDQSILRNFNNIWVHGVVTVIVRKAGKASY